jgi:hypothetical protein
MLMFLLLVVAAVAEGAIRSIHPAREEAGVVFLYRPYPLAVFPLFIIALGPGAVVQQQITPPELMAVKAG